MVRRILPLAGVLIVTSLSVGVRSDDPVSSAVTFSREVIRLPLQRIPADQEYVVRRVVVDTGLRAPRRLRHIEILPANNRVMRAAFVSMVKGAASDARWVGAWTQYLAVQEHEAGIGDDLRRS
jgi:hypothetical protein